VELESSEILGGPKGRVRRIAILGEDKENTGGTDVVSRSRFSGAVCLDPDRRLNKSLGLTVGGVVLIDPEGVVRWVKPGTRYKRPRLVLVEHAVRAILARDAEEGLVDELLEELDSTSAGKRRKAVQALGELEAVEARERLERALLEDRAPGVRTEAARALRWLRDERSLPALGRAAIEQKREVRLAAAEVLVEFGNDFDLTPGRIFRHEYTHASREPLEAAAATLLPSALWLVDHHRIEERRLGARLLWRIGAEEGKERLLELTGERDEKLRYAALGGLERWRDEEDVRVIAGQLVEDSSERIGAMARLILEGPVGKVRE